MRIFDEPEETGMAKEIPTGTYGFRFTPPSGLSLCNLFAVGRDVVKDPEYRWNGLTRMDGPLLLFQYTFDGEGEFQSSGETYRMGAGRALMTEIPGDHCYYFPEDGEHWSFLFILMRPDVIEPNWREAKQKLGEVPYLPSGSSPVRLLEDMWEAANAGRITDPYTASSYVYQFVTELCRFAFLPQGDRRDWPEKVRAAAEYMEAHYDRMISLDQLSDNLHVSKHHLIRSFTTAAGVPPGEYLSRIRIEHAMRLLRHTEWSIDRIAESVGYSGGSYFIKVFRKTTGTTPGHFRSGKGQLTMNRLFFD